MEKKIKEYGSDTKRFTSISCILCNLTVVTKEKMLKHILTHENEQPFQCPDCSDLFEDLETFQDHVNLPGCLHSNNCTSLSQSASESDVRNVEIHIQECRKDSIEDIQSLRPSKSLQETNNWEDDHIADIHKHEDAAHILEVPAKSKPGSRNKGHQTVETNNLDEESDKLKQLPQTEQNSIVALKLGSSIIEYDSGNGKNLARTAFNCLTCNKSFSQKYILQTHVRIHSGVKDFQCNYCGRTFVYAGNLKVHLRRHTGDRPYQCRVCKKSFYNASNRSDHEKKHAGEKVRCESCGKYLSDLSSFSKHRRIHAGQKLYQCGICKKNFRQMEHLRKHTRSHSGERPFCCDICKKCFGRKDVLANHSRLHSRKDSKNTKSGEINRP